MRTTIPVPLYDRRTFRLWLVYRGRARWSALKERRLMRRESRYRFTRIPWLCSRQAPRCSPIPRATATR